MQASIHTFDGQTRSGSALLDDGRTVSFAGEVFDASGLRHVRVGQRVSVLLTTDGSCLVRLWIVGIGEGEAIR